MTEPRRNIVGQIIHEGGVLPPHIFIQITHNDHAISYQTAEQWLADVDACRDAVDIPPEDRAEILRTGEVWRIDWHPDNPVGSCSVAAATLGRALELANGRGVPVTERCRQFTGKGGQYSLPVSHVAAGEHHFAERTKFEWPCYDGGPDSVRISDHRSAIAAAALAPRPLLDRDPTPEDLEAELEAPRPGVWAGESGADLRKLTQDETDALIRLELVRSASDVERDAVAMACGYANVGGAQLIMLPTTDAPRLGDQPALFAHIQRGGIDSDPLVRILARRAWGDRDRQWFELRGVRKGEGVEIVPLRNLLTVASVWPGRRATSWPPGTALADACPGEEVEVRWPVRYERPEPSTATHVVSDRLREPPAEAVGYWMDPDIHGNSFPH